MEQFARIFREQRTRGARELVDALRADLQVLEGERGLGRRWVRILGEVPRSGLMKAPALGRIGERIAAGQARGKRASVRGRRDEAAPNQTPEFRGPLPEQLGP